MGIIIVFYLIGVVISIPICYITNNDCINKKIKLYESLKLSLLSWLIVAVFIASCVAGLLDSLDNWIRNKLD